jgi:hypothetical protein
MLEPYAMKVARTVLKGGKLEKAYLSGKSAICKLCEAMRKTSFCALPEEPIYTCV